MDMCWRFQHLASRELGSAQESPAELRRRQGFPVEAGRAKGVLSLPLECPLVSRSRERSHHVLVIFNGCARLIFLWREHLCLGTVDAIYSSQYAHTPHPKFQCWGVDAHTTFFPRMFRSLQNLNWGSGGRFSSLGRISYVY